MYEFYSLESYDMTLQMPFALYVSLPTIIIMLLIQGGGYLFSSYKFNLGYRRGHSYKFNLYIGTFLRFYFNVNPGKCKLQKKKEKRKKVDNFNDG